MNNFRLLSLCIGCMLLSVVVHGQEYFAFAVPSLSEMQTSSLVLGRDSPTPISDRFTSTSDRKKDTVIDFSGSKIKLTFAQRNSGAFKRRRKGGMRSAGTAALCSGLVPGLGQVYNGQWYKAPVIYAGAAVLWYFIDLNLGERKTYDKEIRARNDSNVANLNLSLAKYTTTEILDLRNYYEHNFELAVIIAGVVYLLNIVDAVVYAHLSNFNVSPNLSLKIEPYAQTNFYVKQAMPLDVGLKLCFTFK